MTSEKDIISRRDFLKLTTLGIGAGFLAACGVRGKREPSEEGQINVAPTEVKPTSTPSPTSTPTKEPTPTLDIKRAKIESVISKEEQWLQAGVPEQTLERWKKESAEGKRSADLETFAAQALIVEDLLSQGKLQDPQSLETKDPKNLSYKVKFVADKEGKEMPAVCLVDEEGRDYITSINQPLDKAGFPTLDYPEKGYSSLFRVPQLLGMSYEIVNFNQVKYTGEKVQVMMTPQDLNDGFDKFYYPGTMQNGRKERFVWDSFNSLLDTAADDSKTEFLPEVIELLKVSEKRPAAALYTAVNVEPRIAQKMVGLELASLGKESTEEKKQFHLERFCQVVEIIEDVARRPELEELAPYIMGGNREDPVFTCFWAYPPLRRIEAIRKGGLAISYNYLRSDIAPNWKGIKTIFYCFGPTYLENDITPKEAAANVLMRLPMDELWFNDKVNLKYYDGYGRLDQLVKPGMSLKDLLEEANKINDGKTANGEVGAIHFFEWIWNRIKQSSSSTTGLRLPESGEFRADNTFYKS
uniref:Twin-arginine translocation signal domain-containing protein n=1 Tax=candidate division CPR3 bacterium TaxID=2268181 RepID=A0A7V3N424_UNCC3